MASTIKPLSRSGSAGSASEIRFFDAAWRSRCRAAAPSAASANRLSAAVCCSSDHAPANSATAASSAVRRLATRSRRISAAASSAASARFSTASAISPKSGSGPSATRRFNSRHSLTASPLRNGLLPNIDASSRRPSGAAPQSRALCAAGSSVAAASASSHASKPSASRRESAGRGGPLPSSGKSFKANVIRSRAAKSPERSGCAPRQPLRASIWRRLLTLPSATPTVAVHIIRAEAGGNPARSRHCIRFERFAALDPGSQTRSVVL